MLLLGGCSDDPDPSPDPEPDPGRADGHRRGRPADLRPADDGGGRRRRGGRRPGAPDGDPETVYYDDELESCVFASERYEFDEVFGEGASWDDVRAATEEVLEPEGFELTEQLDIPGGFNGFDATTDDGTVVEVRSKLGNPSTISLDAPVTGYCD